MSSQLWSIILIIQKRFQNGEQIAGKNCVPELVYTDK